MFRVNDYFAMSLEGHFLFAFRSNRGRIFGRFDTIHERDRHPAIQIAHDGIDRAYIPQWVQWSSW